jgi:hypothetical protein
MTVILATQDHSSKPARANSSRDPISKKTLHKSRADGVAQGEGPVFKPQYCKQTNKQTNKKSSLNNTGTRKRM